MNHQQVLIAVVVYGLTVCLVLQVLQHKERMSSRKHQHTPQEPDIVIYKAQWCGHCKHFQPEIEKLQQFAPRYGYTVQVYDADADAEYVQAAGVKGFPTVNIGGTVYEGERTSDAILIATSSRCGA